MSHRAPVASGLPWLSQRHGCSRVVWLVLALSLKTGLPLLTAVSMVAAQDPPAAELPAAAPDVDFSRDVLPILQASCLACHNESTADGDVILESAASMTAAREGGAVIVPGDPDGSVLMGVASHRDEPLMPPPDNDVNAKPLSKDQLDVLAEWIRQGAKPSADSSTSDFAWTAVSPALVAVYALDLDWEGRFVAAGRANRVLIYDRTVPDGPTSLIDPELSDLAPSAAIPIAHRDFVHSVAFAPEGNLLATAGFQVVKLWSRQFPDAAVSVPAESPAAPSFDRLESGAVVQVAAQGGVAVAAPGAETAKIVSVPDRIVTAVCAAGVDSTTVLCGTSTGDILLVNTDSGEVLGLLESEPDVPVTQMARLPGSLDAVALLDGGLIRFVRVAEDRTISLVSETTLAEATILRAISDGALVVVEDSVVVHLARDGATESFRVATEEPIRDIAGSRTADRLAVLADSGRLRLFSLSDQKLVSELARGGRRQQLTAKAESLKAVRETRLAHVNAIIANRQKELTDQQGVHSKSVETHQAALAEHTTAREGFTAAKAATAAAREALAAAAEDEALKKAVEEAEKAEAAAMGTAEAAEKKERLAMRDAELAQQAVVRLEQVLKDAQAAAEIAQSDLNNAVTALADLQNSPEDSEPLVAAGLLSDGATAAACTADGRLLTWSAADGRFVESVHVSPALTSARFVSGDDLIAFQADGRCVMRNGHSVWTLSATLQFDDAGRQIFPERVYSLAFSPDGKQLAAGGGEASRSGMIAIWNTDDHRVVNVLSDIHSDVVYDLQYSPDGRLLVSASADKFAKVLDASAGTIVRDLEGHTSQVLGAAWNAAQSRIATAGADNAIKIWNTDTGLQERTISVYGKQVSSVRFTDRSGTLLSCSGDQRVFLHNADDGKAVRELPRSPDYVHRAVPSGRGDIVAAGCEDGHVRIWNAADGKVIADFAPDLTAGR